MYHCVMWNQLGVVQMAAAVNVRLEHCRMYHCVAQNQLCVMHVAVTVVQMMAVNVQGQDT